MIPMGGGVFVFCVGGGCGKMFVEEREGSENKRRQQKKSEKGETIILTGGTQSKVKKRE